MSTITTTVKPETEASIKPTSNSVSNGCTLAALKQHITTCLHRWRQKLPIKRNKKSKASFEHQQQQEEYQCKCQTTGGKFRRYTRKEFFGSGSFVKRSTVSCKLFKANYQTLLTKPPSQDKTVQQFSTSTDADSKGPRTYGRKVEIVAKLLSSSLVGSSIAVDDTSYNTSLDDYLCCQQQKRRGSADSAYHSIQESQQLEIFESSVLSTATSGANEDAGKMTITELTFMEIRDEYPDLDSEIRSILTARAKDGATISDIRDDYRKLTGLTFPVYDSVTEFLLTIPHVSAYCNEKGTRIFNIRPMEKTKHIHDMVMNQKTSQDTVHNPYKHRRFYREHQRNQNYYPYNWRLNSSFRRQQPQQNCQPPKYPPPYAEKDVFTNNVKNLPITAGNNENDNHNNKNLSPEDSEGFIENNWYYNDNCHYFNNRFCNQEPAPLVISSQLVAQGKPQTMDDYQHQPMVEPIPPVPPSDFNNLDMNAPTYENNINHLNNIYQLQEHPTNANNIMGVNPRRSSVVPYKGFGYLPISSRSTSPTGKSCYTNDSMFTDTDYEAHLLDFLLLGDDFFLYMARMELRCKFKKNQRILQSGLCVSGQTINSATKRISVMNGSGRSVIINIGSVNIMQGHHLIQIQHEFRELIVTMQKKGIKPILTTLAPLANYTHNREIKVTLERFNEYIKREGERRNLIVIDIWKRLVNDKGQVLFDCYQNEPRTVTGAAESYLFWNNIGRQRVLNLIESNLEY